MPQLLPIPLFLPLKSNLSYPKQKTSINGPETFVELVENANNYAAIKTGVNDLLRKGIYTVQNEYIYWYRISTSTECYAGLLCGLPSEDCSHPTLTTHEHVLDKRVKRFADYLSATQLQAEPILVIHENTSFSDDFTMKIAQKKCTHCYNLGKEKHELWALDTKESQEVIAFARTEKQLHLADGHHRLASSLHYAENKQNCMPVFSFIVAKNQLKNDCFIWTLKQLPKQSPLLASMKRKKPLEQASIEVLYGNQKHDTALPETGNAVTFLLADVLGFSTEDAVDLGEYIDYFPPTASLTTDFFESSAPYEAKFFYPSLSLEEIIRTAKALKKLPPKSTYIQPKLPTGLFIAPMSTFK